MRLYNIECTYNGKVYEGQYRVDNGLMTVFCEHGRQTTQVTGASDMSVARMALIQILIEASLRGKPE